jgi:uncharacterized protein
MLLKQQILELQKQAMKTGQKEKLSTLRLLTSEIKNKEISLKKELDDTEVERVIASEVKKLKDSLIDFEAAGRDDLSTPVKNEIEVLQVFLPEQMTDEELQKIVKETIEEMKPDGKKDFGRVMGTVMSKVSGRADGNRVKDLLNSVL